MKTGTIGTCPRPRCGGKVRPGIALAPVLGNHRVRDRYTVRGLTLYAVDGKVIQVNKCARCGHSVTH
jgi:hypothetical protein